MLLYAMISRLLICLCLQGHMCITGVKQREQLLRYLLYRSIYKHPKHSAGGQCLWPVHLNR